MIQERKYSWLPRLVAEFFVVVVSVLLALAVDEWRGNRALDRQVRQARAAFAEEIAGNRAKLLDEHGLKYHEAYWDAYKRLTTAYYNNNNAEVQKLLADVARDFNTGIHPPLLRDAVWRSFSESDLIRHMDPKEVFILADIYREQENLDEWFRRMLSIWMEAHPYKDNPAYIRDDANTTRMFFADVVSYERRLLKAYDEALTLLARDDVER